MRGNAPFSLSPPQSQLEAAEESKRLLTSEVVLLRKQLAESIEANGTMRQEKDSLETRASEFAVERAELRATLDTLQAEKVGVSMEGSGRLGCVCLKLASLGRVRVEL